MKKWLGMGLVLALLSLPLNGFAEEEKDKTSTLDDMVVTATRSASETGSIGGISASVITAEDIEAKKQTSVDEILKGIPGLDIAQNGGPGTTASVFLRGADSKNTLVLVDGVMLNDPSSPNRNANIGALTADNIERIEVIRGPSSVLYGSNATAGVINIITKKGKDKPSVYLGAEGGSYNTWREYGGISGKSGIFNYALSASHLYTEGFSTADDDNDRIPHDGNTVEKDGHKNATVSGKFGVDINPDFDVNLVVRYFDTETDTDDSANGYVGDRFGPAGPPTWSAPAQPNGKKDARVESKHGLGKLTVHNFFMDRFLESTFSYQASKLDRKTFDNDNAQKYNYDGQTQEVSWQGSLDFDGADVLTLGTSYFMEEMKSNSIDSKDADTTSVWVQNQFFVGQGLDVVAGLRYDHHDRFDGKTTWRVAPAYTFQGTETTLKASYGTGFRAPSLFELYSSYGNKDLKPEESEGWDVGVEQGFLDRTLKLNVTYFYMEYTNRIGYDTGTSKYNQLPGDTLSHGVETSIQWLPSDILDFTFAYTYNDTKDHNGEKLVRRPENKFSLNTQYRPMEKLSLNLDLHWVSDREAYSGAKDKDGNSVDVLESYFLANIAASYDLTDHVQLYGRVDNIFDEDYEEAWGYATPGLSGYAGVKLNF